MKLAGMPTGLALAMAYGNGMSGTDMVFTQTVTEMDTETSGVTGLFTDKPYRG